MSNPSNFEEEIIGRVTTALAHDSAIKQVTGKAQYIDDMPEFPETLHLAPYGSPIAAGNIISMELDAVLASEGVVAVLTAKDIKGLNDTSPTHSGDDPVLAKSKVRFCGEPVFAVIATSRRLARLAAMKGKIEIEAAKSFVLNIDDAVKENTLTSPDYAFGNIDAKHELEKAKHRVSSSLVIGGQDHFYLEGQICYAVPKEEEGDGTRDLTLYCSTQHPSEVQHNVAHVLDVPAHSLNVEVRRMGGGFGGKESQATQWAALVALAAVKTGKPVKCRLDRDDDMVMTGKRHDFSTKMEVGFDQEGHIQAVNASLQSRAGCSKDLTDAIVDRAMFHFDNAYYMPHCHISTKRLQTNTVSNTAFRGFGGPQGMLAGEWMMEGVARHLGEDPLTIRKRNLYDSAKGKDQTPYGMKVQDFILHEMIENLEQSSDYWQRRKEITEFNKNNHLIKRGLALNPVKFGISFTTSFLNQAGALVHVYKDGSVTLNHGGTEMGQGLFIKIAQVVADVFQLEVNKVKITATSTDKVPNTSATAASSGSDMNGMAAFNAANEIKNRLIDFACSHYKVERKSILFLKGRVRIGNDEIPFEELVTQAYFARVQLSCAGFYKTPDIDFNRETGQGRPFYYFAYGAAVSEVAIDCLTGESRCLGVDILHDVGTSLNPAIDLGQIEGGFIQGMGWLMMEELWWDQTGKLRTHAPSTYKIPTLSDRPPHMKVDLWPHGRNVMNSIHRSKAVGEPPFMLAISTFLAIADAISSLKDYKALPQLDAPATPENILKAITDMKAKQN